MTLFQILTDTQSGLGMPCSYGYHSERPELPYLVIIGAGQDQFEADNTYYTKKNRWQIEYYFKDKDLETEESIENLLLSNGYKYTKSEDVYIETEDVFVIYYDI